MELLNVKVLEDIDAGRPLKLNLGAGQLQNDFYSLDICMLEGIDILADLNEPLDKLPNGCVSEVYSRHVFEHISNFLGLMEEIHRICRQDAKIKIIVPHFSNVYAFSDPTHVRFFGLYTMNYFVPQDSQPQNRKVPSYYVTSKFALESVRIEFYKNTLFERIIVPFISRLVNISFGTQEFYERRLSSIFHAWQIEYNLRVIGKSQRG